MRRTAAVLLLAGCGSDPAFKPPAQAPSLLLLSPEDGSSWSEGVPIEVRVLVTDPDHTTDALTLSLALDGAPTCDSAAPDADGVLSCTLEPEPGGGALTVSATDPDGETGRLSASFDVIENDAPQVVLDAPDPEARWYPDDAVTLRATVSDDTDAPDALAVDWVVTGSATLTDSTGARPSGEAQATVVLDEGTAELGLTVTDLDGRSTTVGTALSVGPPNRSPSCEIVSGDERVREGGTAEFSATASDPDQPADTLTHAWVTNTEGVVSGGSPAEDGAISYAAVVRDRPGTILELTLRVLDERDLLCEATTELAVNFPPVIDSVVISPSPATATDTLTCVATATDDDDDEETLELSYTWSDADTGAFIDEAATLDLAVYGARTGDRFRCTARAVDGIDQAEDSVVVDVL